MGHHVAIESTAPEVADMLGIESCLAAEEPSAFVSKGVTPLDLSFLDRFFSRIWFERIGKSSTVETYLPLLRIHCPRVKGCKATYTDATTASRNVSYSVSFFGIGTGGGKTVQCTDIREYDASEECTEVAAKSKLVVTYGNLKLKEKTIMTGVMVDIDEIRKEDVKVKPLSKAKDRCGLTLAGIAQLQANDGYETGSFDLKAMTPKSLQVKKVDSIKHERKDDFSFELPISIQGATLKIGLSAERIVSTEVGVECQMVGGKKYYWYCSGGKTKQKSMECFWSIAN
jgi:hypothetical protein